MPATQTKLPSGIMVLIFTCEACGAPAPFGFGCIATAGRSGAENGRWYCASVAGAPACKATGEPVLVPQRELEPLPAAMPAPKSEDLFKW